MAKRLKASELVSERVLKCCLLFRSERSDESFEQGFGMLANQNKIIPIRHFLLSLGLDSFLTEMGQHHIDIITNLAQSLTLLRSL